VGFNHQSTNQTVVPMVAEVGHVLEQNGAEWLPVICLVDAVYQPLGPHGLPGIGDLIPGRHGLIRVQPNRGPVGIPDIVEHKVRMQGDPWGNRPIRVVEGHQGRVRLDGETFRLLDSIEERDLDSFALTAPDYQRFGVISRRHRL